MCGLVGIVGEVNADILIEFLQYLEYRGYDSAGIALLSNNDIRLIKAIGTINNLKDKVSSLKLENSYHTGIGHTRWATHGKPTENNTHPILVNNIMVVHNGIIENYASIKADLEKEYTFKSATDTEVIAALVDSSYSQTNDLLSAIQKTVKRLKGKFAFAVIANDQPHKIIAFTTGVSMYVGETSSNIFLVSDKDALNKFSNECYEVQENQFVEIYQKQFNILDIKLNKIKHSVISITKKEDFPDKAPYKHFMLKEIHEQSESIKNTYKQLEIFSQYCNYKNIKSIYIIGCGSALHAGMVAKYWFEDIGIPTRFEIASEFQNRKTAYIDNTLFIFISQSGETADTIGACNEVNKCKNSTIETLTITNNLNSKLASMTDKIIYTQCGKEIGVASTKAFTSQLLVLLFLAHIISKKPFYKLDYIAKHIKEVLGLEKEIKKIAKTISGNDKMLFLGKHIFFPIALEGALKMKELSYIPVEGIASGELKHGPLAMVDNTVPIIAFGPKNNTFLKFASNIHEVVARNGKVILFTNKNNNSDLRKHVMKYCNVPEIDEQLLPISYAIISQLLAYHVCIERKLDPDKPRNLAKSVTVE